MEDDGANPYLEKKLSPNEPMKGVDGTVVDFWAWGFSDLLMNTTRSVLAEFLVGKRLGIIDTPRLEWIPYDFKYREKKIEVKSSAYLQSWNQRGKHNKPKFDIKPRKTAWDNSLGKSTNIDEKRQADYYIFCLFNHKEKGTANVLDVDAWEFYSISKEKLESDIVLPNHSNKNSISLSTISEICVRSSYEGLKRTIDSMIDGEPKVASH